MSKDVGSNQKKASLIEFQEGYNEEETKLTNKEQTQDIQEYVSLRKFLLNKARKVKSYPYIQCFLLVLVILLFLYCFSGGKKPKYSARSPRPSSNPGKRGSQAGT